MAPAKALKATREIIDSSSFSKYDPHELTDTFKGKIVVLNPEKSEIATSLKIIKKGTYAVKLG